jgi:hypothetical protein
MFKKIIEKLNRTGITFSIPVGSGRRPFDDLMNQVLFLLLHEQGNLHDNTVTQWVI